MTVVRAMQEQLPGNQKHRSQLIGEECVIDFISCIKVLRKLS